MVSHAPQAPARTKPIAYDILAAGLLTTAAALGGNALLIATTDYNVMAQHTFFVLPTGAIMVGLVAGSGYGAWAWLRGIRIRRLLLASILMLQIGAYFQLHWIEYRIRDPHRPGGRPESFFDYFRRTTRLAPRAGGLGPLHAGWPVLRLLEIIGFAAGALFVPAIVAMKHYCDRCEMYMHTRTLARLPAGVSASRLKMQRQQMAPEAQKAFRDASRVATALLEAADSVDVHAFEELVEQYSQPLEKLGDISAFLEVQLVCCPGCMNAMLLFHKAVPSMGRFDQRPKVDRAPLGVTGVSPQFAASALQFDES